MFACMGVTRLDGARGKKQVWRPRGRTGAHMVEPELFRNKIYCTEESSLLVTMLGLFGASRSK